MEPFLSFCFTGWGEGEGVTFLGGSQRGCVSIQLLPHSHTHPPILTFQPEYILGIEFQFLLVVSGELKHPQLTRAPSTALI